MLATDPAKSLAAAWGHLACCILTNKWDSAKEIILSLRDELSTKKLEFDLTQVLCQFLDPHLALRLIEFAEKRQVYNEKDILQAKFDIVKKTTIPDLISQVFSELYPGQPLPAEYDVDLEEKRDLLLEEYQESCGEIMPILQDGELVETLRQDGTFTLAFLISEYKEFLNEYSLVKQRAWLLHWSLFVFFNAPKTSPTASAAADEASDEDADDADDTPIETVIDDTLIDLFSTSEVFRQALQLHAPHLLRYLAVVVVIFHRRRLTLLNLMSMFNQEAHIYADPILELISCVYRKFDFDSARGKILECKAVFENDYFLNPYWDQFFEAARLFIFETYSQIHKRIDNKMLAEYLHLDMEAAERWIVNMIRNASLDAKIDSTNNVVIMGQSQRNPNAQVIEITRGQEIKNQGLLQRINELESSQNSTTSGAAGARGGAAGGKPGNKSGPKSGGLGSGGARGGAGKEGGHTAGGARGSAISSGARRQPATAH
ncbi:hypothetical protein H696_05663 [Fonticula alba]|uniref:PCI domain-containing protein n=1 Tax=Fonticula alba TaxID=691883 RepID=A0A058Z1Y8_FONAL|nr:hypothetical protein H696_05663 [Fonticula alba]KCV67938.1 hypothetical protein H696_05663 [Fonticula alba]|eukprot:XP_009497758.1 hypothetical protein H696_05663 [Fonticula alba]